MSIQCPTCHGKGTVTAIGIRYAHGHSGPPVRELDCFDCDGEKTIRDDRLEWIKRGDELRDRRVNDLGLTLRAASAKWGMSPSELSAIESGRVDNLSWNPPETSTEASG